MVRISEGLQMLMTHHDNPHPFPSERNHHHQDPEDQWKDDRKGGLQDRKKQRRRRFKNMGNVMSDLANYPFVWYFAFDTAFLSTIFKNGPFQCLTSYRLESYSTFWGDGPLSLQAILVKSTDTIVKSLLKLDGNVAPASLSPDARDREKSEGGNRRHLFLSASLTCHETFQHISLPVQRKIVGLYKGWKDEEWNEFVVQKPGQGMLFNPLEQREIGEAVYKRKRTYRHALR
ncbi:hypothetical protein llap_2537 [Limosa lapponica baueri]|uniref:Uncharacterized protein n=1 Tax=Limosa lapponica baueri TaxID=1758121 RepID=A0A2I0UMA8_LIMLA|nr:hypothetical protein llap_2537 [Limosa lapponica baueri]